MRWYAVDLEYFKVQLRGLERRKTHTLWRISQTRVEYVHMGSITHPVPGQTLLLSPLMLKAASICYPTLTLQAKLISELPDWSATWAQHQRLERSGRQEKEGLHCLFHSRIAQQAGRKNHGDFHNYWYRFSPRSPIQRKEPHLP